MKTLAAALLLLCALSGGALASRPPAPAPSAAGEAVSLAPVRGDDDKDDDKDDDEEDEEEVRGTRRVA